MPNIVGYNPLAPWLDKAEEERQKRLYTPSWWESLRGGAAAGAGGLLESVGGLLDLYQKYSPGTMLFGSDEAREKAARTARALAEAGQGLAAEYAPPGMEDMWRWDPRKMAYGATTNVAQQLPSLIAGNYGGSASALTGMFATSFGQEYMRGQEAGLDEPTSLIRGLLYGGIEAVTELWSMDTLFKRWGVNPVKQAVKFIAEEGGQEVAAESLEALVDKATTQPNMTLGDFKTRMYDMLASLPASIAGTMAAGKGIQTLTQQQAAPSAAPAATPQAEAPIVYSAKGKTQTSTPEFKEWFGKSKVTDDRGKPLKVYHGTTHDVETFGNDYGNPENDMGVGFYFSTSPKDVNANYAGEGPDLSMRIGALADRMEMEDPGLSHEKAIELARSQLSGGAPNVMAAYISLNNPVILGGKKETKIGGYKFNERTGEESGQAVELLNALNDVAPDFYGIDVPAIWGDIGDLVMEKAPASEVISAIKNSEGAAYAEDESGAFAKGEYVRRVLERMGYDGIIDKTVPDKFGPRRRFGRPMEMDEDTQHIIAFAPEQIKSAIGNRGTFSRTDPRVWATRSPVRPVSYINSDIGVVVAEAVPSTSTEFGAKIVGATKGARDAYTKEAFSLIHDEKGNDVILKALRKKPVSQAIGQGTFEGAVSPNILTGISEKRQGPQGALEYNDEVADLYSLSMMYVFEQDGVPWMRFDPKAEGDYVTHGARVRFSELNGDVVDRFYQHLQNYIKGGEFTVLGNDVVTLNFSDMTNEEFDAAFTRAVQDFDVPATEIVGGLKSKGNYHDIQEYAGEKKWADEEAAKRALEDEFSRRGRSDLLPTLRDRNAAVRKLNAAYTPEEIAKYNLNLSHAELKEIGDNLREAIFRSDGWDRRPSEAAFKVTPRESVTEADLKDYQASFDAMLPIIKDEHIEYRKVDDKERLEMVRIIKSAQEVFPYGIREIVHGIAVFDPVDDDGNRTYAQYIPAQNGHDSHLVINSNFLNAMQSDDNADLAAPLISSMLHELGHAVDVGSNSNSTSHAMQASAFFIDPLDVEIVASNNRVGGKVKWGGADSVGPLMREVIDLWQSKKAHDVGLDDYFDYPLLQLGAVAVKGKIWDTPVGAIELGRNLYDTPIIGTFVNLIAGDLNNIQGEVFAQLHSLYYTHPGLMEEYLPKSYKFMQEVDNAVREARSITAINRGLSNALRSSRATRGFAGEQGRYNHWREPGRYFNASTYYGAAGRGVGEGPVGLHPQQAQQGWEPQGQVAYNAQSAGQTPPQQEPPFVTESRQGASAEDLANKAKRGTQSWQATENLARALGITPEELDKFVRREIGTAFNAEQLNQAAMLFTQHWHTAQAEFMGMVNKLDSGEMTDKDWVRVEEVLHQINANQAQFMGVRGEAGRALNIFNKIRNTTKLSEAVQEVLDAHGGRDMLEAKLRELAKLEEPGLGMKAIREEMKVTRWDQFFEWRTSILVSGIPTHVVNMTSNMLTSILEDIDRFVTAGIGALHGGEKVRFREAAAHVAGYLPGAVAGLTAAGKALADEDSPLHFQGKFDQVHRRAIPGTLGKVIRMPLRFLGAEDAFFKTMAMTKELYALASRHGISFDQARHTPELIEQAWEEGMRRTFTNRPGQMANAIRRARRGSPFLNFIVPFVNTPANIVNYALHHTPAAIGYKEVRADLKKGGIKRDQALARIATGSSIGLAVMGLAAAGLISGAPPEDPNKRRLWHAAGNQPYSLKVGDTWYSYSRLEPIGMLFGISADIYRLSQVLGTDEADKIATLVVGSISNNLFSKTYLKGISDTLMAITDPEQYGERWIKSLAVSTVSPVFLSYTAKAVDPNLREAETILEALKARTPGMSQQLEPRLDVFGRERKTEGSGLYRMVSPAYIKKDIKDPVANELLRLDVSMPAVGKKVRGVELSTMQRNELKKVLGQSVYSAVQRLIVSPQYKAMPDPLKAWTLDKVVSGVRRYGKLYWEMRHQDVMREAMRLKAEEALTRGE